MLETGTIVSGYRVEGVLGEGGMGTVYRATQLSLNRTVALKVLAGEFSDDETFRERFRREGLLQAAIDHAHIVTVYEAGETEDGLFLAMRLVRGPTLKDEIFSKQLTPERTVRILLAVADALDAAHEVGLIHRDVKPQNILVGARDHAYLADFGLTKVPDESGGLTGTGQFVGTIDYIAPEQVRGEGADHRSDVYALAGVLYECLTGSVPYPRASEPAVLFAHMSDPPPSLREMRPDLPAELDALIARGMAKDREERFSTAGELIRSAARSLGTPTADAQGRTGAGDGQATKPAAAAPGDLTAARHAVTAPAGNAVAPGGETVRAGGAVTEPRAPAARPAAPPARRPARALIAAGAGLLAVAAVAGFVLGGSGSDSGSEPAADFANSASAGSIELSFPADWERASSNADLPGLDLTDPMTLAPQGEEGDSLTAGTAAAVGATLLPAGLVRRLPEAPEGQPVRLGELEAYRHAGLRPRGFDDQLTVYVVPTTGGVATVACRARAGASADFLESCERVAATLELSGIESLPLGPSEEYARVLGEVLGAVGAARRSAGTTLREADTRPAQARAARSLSRAHGVAANALARATTGPADRAANASIVGALRRLRGGYAQLAAAADRGDGGAYSATSGAIGAAEERLQRSLAALERLGYDVS